MSAQKNKRPSDQEEDKSSNKESKVVYVCPIHNGDCQVDIDSLRVSGEDDSSDDDDSKVFVRDFPSHFDGCFTDSDDKVREEEGGQSPPDGWDGAPYLWTYFYALAFGERHGYVESNAPGSLMRQTKPSDPQGHVENPHDPMDVLDRLFGDATVFDGIHIKGRSVNSWPYIFQVYIITMPSGKKLYFTFDGTGLENNMPVTLISPPVDSTTDNLEGLVIHLMRHFAGDIYFAGATEQVSVDKTIVDTR